MKNQNITIVEVAKLAGVSTATVSRTLSNPDVVRPTTRDRVISAITQLDWQPNEQARQMALLLGRYRKGLRK
jgi:LacI family transcriptional regulator